MLHFKRLLTGFISGAIQIKVIIILLYYYIHVICAASRYASHRETHDICVHQTVSVDSTRVNTWGWHSSVVVVVVVVEGGSSSCCCCCCSGGRWLLLLLW